MNMEKTYILKTELGEKEIAKGSTIVLDYEHGDVTEEDEYFTYRDQRLVRVQRLLEGREPLIEIDYCHLKFTLSGALYGGNGTLPRIHPFTEEVQRDFEKTMDWRLVSSMSQDDWCFLKAEDISTIAAIIRARRG